METNRKYFACSVCAPGEDYCEENFNRIINQKGFVLHSATLQKGTFSSIQVNDILILKYNNHFIAYGKVHKIDIGKGEGWNHWAYVDEWFFYDNENKKEGVYKYGIGWATIGGGQMGTVKTVTSKFGIEKARAINSQSALFLEIEKEDKVKLDMEEIQEKINILKYKKQIILQGPPGTGKTKLAKEIAKVLTGGQKKISLLEYVTNYIKEFKTNEENKKINKQSEELLNEFQETFNLENIKKISIENYALGSGSQDSFCYWIERELAPICKFSPGGAGTTVYGISYKKDSGEIRVDNNEDPQAFMIKVREALIEIIETKNFEKARELKFWYSYILKILHSYFPNDYFPVLSKEHLKIFAKILNIDSKGLNDIELNQAINSKFLDLKNQNNSEITSVLLMRHLYSKLDIKESGMPEMLILDNEINITGESKIIQFHPSYTYEDFVRGIMVENKEGKLEYISKNKILAAFAKKALLNLDSNYVLIIDEINRANLSSVLGELIYALEYREEEVESMYSLKDENGEETNVLKLPNNLYIIGTMNTADRSVGHIDYAIRRRFAFVDVLPENLKEKQGLKSFHEALFLAVEKLFKEHTSPEFEVKDVQLGHSYFIDKSNEENGAGMDIRLEYEIKPILLEYLKDGVLIGKGKDIKKEIEELQTLL